MSDSSRLTVGTLCLSGVGGSGVVAADVSTRLAERGHEVHLVSDRAPFRLEDIDVPVRLHTAGVPDAPALARAPITLALASKLAEVIQKQRLDVIHVHYAVPNAVAARLARLVVGPSAPPTVVTLHGTDVTPVGSDPAYRAVTREALLDATVWTAPSEDLAAVAYEALGLPGHRPIRVIPNFVDVECFEPSPRPCPSRPFTVIHVSNFRPVKRVGDAVLSFAKMAEALKPSKARLLLVGDGPDRPRVETTVRSLGICDRVRFLGVRHDVARWLRHSDVALVPSGSESFGLSALEALAAALPVVATRVGGLSDVVRDGETGLLAPVGDTDALAAHLVRLARNPELRRRMGETGRDDAGLRFPPDRALEGYEKALFDAVSVASTE